MSNKIFLIPYFKINLFDQEFKKKLKNIVNNNIDNIIYIFGKINSNIFKYIQNNNIELHFVNIQNEILLIEKNNPELSKIICTEKDNFIEIKFNEKENYFNNNKLNNYNSITIVPDNISDDISSNNINNNNDNDDNNNDSSIIVSSISDNSSIMTNKTDETDNSENTENTENTKNTENSMNDNNSSTLNTNSDQQNLSDLMETEKKGGNLLSSTIDKSFEMFSDIESFSLENSLTESNNHLFSLTDTDNKSDIIASKLNFSDNDDYSFTDIMSKLDFSDKISSKNLNTTQSFEEFSEIFS